MNPSDSDAAWSLLGRTDPYFAVLTRERYRRRRLNPVERAAFYGTGVRHVEAMFGTIERLAPGFRPRRALDFGCGVGRILAPLAERCGAVLGVDVSADMLEEAQAHCDAAGVRNVELIRGYDDLAGVTGSFDLVHSYIVFQHLAAARQRRLLERLVERLDDGGIGVIHFLYRRHSGLATRVAGWARKHVPLANGLINVGFRRAPFSEPLMEMNPLPPGEVLEILQRAGCGELSVEFSDHPSRGAENLGIVVAFRKAPGQAW